MMLRMSLRDPRVSKAVRVRLRCDVGSVDCKLQYPRDFTVHSIWVLLPLNIVVLVGFLFLMLRDIWKPTA
jgi:hypothetical protein